jgi:hypothetical protein
MIAAPMHVRPFAALRRGRPPLLLPGVLLVGVLLAACSSTSAPSGTPGLPSPSGMTVAPTPSPSPTPLPTPDFTNTADPTLSALIPDTVDGAQVFKPDPTSYGVSPGDIAMPFGDIGLRFRSLVIAYVVRPRLSLYAMRVEGPSVDTADLKPYLAAAGRYIGVSGLQPDAWKAAVVNGNRVWTRGEDEATLPKTTFYCWSSGQYVFLMTGSSDATNQAMVSALPGQPAPTPTPTASPVASGSAAPGGSAAAGATATTSPSGV